MTSILSKLTTGRKGRAQKVVIYGPESVGKSTLGSQFPSPLFLDVEDSTSQLDVRRLGRDALPDLAAFESALVEVAATQPCASLVVDTIDWLEPLAEAAIVKEKNSPKIQCVEDFGYGKGWVALKDRLTITLSLFDRVILSGIHVVLLAHSKVMKFEPPDGAGPYDRYEMKLSKHVTPLLKEWADMLAFYSWRTQVRERDKDESGQQFKGVGGKERMLYFAHAASWDAKNRHGLGDVEKADIAVIEKAFRSVGAPWNNRPAAAEAGIAMPVIKEVEKTEVAKLANAPDNGAASNGVDLPVKAALGVQVPPSVPAEDQIPDIANPPVPVLADLELERICGPHSDEVTAYLRKENRIKPNEDWRSMPADFAKRIKKNPAGFLKAAVRVKEVAA